MKKIIGALWVFVAVAAIYSCANNEVNYTPAEILDTEQVFFSSSNSATIDLSSLTNSFEIPIARINTNDAVTVPLTVTSNDTLFRYTIPTSVSFAQGESESTIVITYNPDSVGYDNFTNITLRIGDEAYATPYGMSEYSFTVSIPAPWVSLGFATYSDDYLTIYGVDVVAYSVEIEENELQPGLFRLVNPYGEAFPHNESGDWDNSKDWYLEIHAEDPTAVYINMQETGLDWGNGMATIGSVAGYLIETGSSLEEVKAAGYTGTYENGVITFPVGYLLISLANYNNGALLTANSNGGFMVAMPGVVVADYSIEVAYGGKYTNERGVDTGVLAQISEVGGDVESVRLAVVEGTDVEAAVEGINNGSIESVEVQPTPATILVPFASAPVEGRYTLVAVAYADGQAQESASAEFGYTASTSETWTARYVGDYTYTLYFISEDGPLTDPGLTLYQSNDDPNRWKIENWGNSLSGVDGVDFIFTYNQETSEVVVADQETGYLHPTYGRVFVNEVSNVNYEDVSSQEPSHFEEGVFYFEVIYYVSAGYIEFGVETFTITGDALSVPTVKSMFSPLSIWKNLKFIPKNPRTKNLKDNFSGKLFIDKY